MAYPPLRDVLDGVRHLLRGASPPAIVLLFMFCACSDDDPVTSLNNPPLPPSNPTPAHQAVDVTTTATLGWIARDPDGDRVTSDVYFGTSSSPPLKTTDQAMAMYWPGALAPRTIYYWKIVVGDQHGATASGSVWRFTTGAELNRPPSIPSNPSPAHQATNVTTTPTLSWTATDPDGDALIYDVYFGTSASPPLQTLGQPAATYDPPETLTFNTTYFWKIVVIDEHGLEMTGPLTIWSFTTRGAP